MTRTTKTAAQRAQERFEAAQRAVDRAKTVVETKAAAHQEAVKVVRAKQRIVDDRHEEVVAATEAVEKAEKRLEYIAGDPDLPTTLPGDERADGAGAE